MSNICFLQGLTAMWTQTLAPGLDLFASTAKRLLLAFACGLAVQAHAAPAMWVSQIKLADLVPSAQLPAKATVQVDLPKADPRLDPSQCPAPLFANSRGNRMWGRTFVEVQCVGTTLAPFYVPVDVKVNAPVWVVKSLIAQGQTIKADQLALEAQDLTQLQGGWISELAHAEGKVALRTLQAGTALRPDQLRGRALIKRGEQVKVLIKGPGFQIAGAGVSLEDAEQGAPIKVKTDKGKVIQGQAVDELMVEVTL